MEMLKHIIRSMKCIPVYYLCSRLIKAKNKYEKDEEKEEREGEEVEGKWERGGGEKKEDKDWMWLDQVKMEEGTGILC